MDCLFLWCIKIYLAGINQTGYSISFLSIRPIKSSKPPGFVTRNQSTRTEVEDIKAEGSSED